MKSSTQSSGRTPFLATLAVVVVLAAASGYYYYVTSSALSANSQTISSLNGQVFSLNGQILSIYSSNNRTVSSLQSQIQSIQSANSVTVSSLQANLTRLQNLADAKASIKIVEWLSSSTDSSAIYQVRVSNNNRFDVTLVQVTLNVVDSFGNQIASNTVAPRITVVAGASATITMAVTPSGGAGTSLGAIITTPYGQIIVGTA